MIKASLFLVIPETILSELLYAGLGQTICVFCRLILLTFSKHSNIQTFIVFEKILIVLVVEILGKDKKTFAKVTIIESFSENIISVGSHSG